MKSKFIKPELLAPAGNLEKMKIAFEYGADAVYFGIPDFSLRVRINQFDKKSIEEAANFCRQQKKKFYVTLNIYAHNRHLKKILGHIKFIKKIKPNGVIISDPGILEIAKRELKGVPVLLSTQSNVTNAKAVKFWQKQGVRRIILARELSLEEVKEIKKEVPKMELEYFIHGAMCMSYSGRCLLSSWMTNRSANLGDCAQPCRWKYDLKSRTMTVIDDQKRFEVELEEDKHGTYFFNSMDLCLIENIGELMKAGVDSLKIEGRAKSVYYVATVVRAYRKVIDAISDFGQKSLKTKKIVEEQKLELDKLSCRGYHKGFLLGSEANQLYNQSNEKTDWSFVGLSKDRKKSAERDVFIHNRLMENDKVELVFPDRNEVANVVLIKGTKGEELNAAHGGQDKIFKITFDHTIDGTFLIRKKEK